MTSTDGDGTDRPALIGSVAALRQKTESGREAALWEAIHERAKTAIAADPIVPTSMYPGRNGTRAEQGIRDYSVTHRAGSRVACAAMAALVTDDERYAEGALRQSAALFDPDRWPEWRDQNHTPGPDADIRTGDLATWLAFAYHWLSPYVDESRREWLVTGLDRRGIGPYLRSLENDAWWLDAMSNWTTRIVGGFGILGMALGEDHPAADHLIEQADRTMARYRERYGPEGEFNEAPEYANATRPVVTYETARRYYAGDDAIAEGPYRAFCRWQTHCTLPPGRHVAFGDTEIDSTPDVSYYPAIAAATGDGVIREQYRRYRETLGPDPLELCWLDESVEPVSPAGRLPQGKGFETHGLIFVSRTDWDPETTASVVYGKAGIEPGHHHHDAGQVCIDGGGRRLIVDVGTFKYPTGYWDNRDEYYAAASRGHNVVEIGGREMPAEPGTTGAVEATFEDDVGGVWQADLSSCYGSNERVERTVVHLHPGFVAVLDEVDLRESERVTLRWHTVTESTPDDAGNFRVRNDDMGLTARISQLDGDGIGFERGEHTYEAPYNTDRDGVALEGGDSYVEASVPATGRCRLLSLFAVGAPGETPSEWSQDGTSRRDDAIQRAWRTTAHDSEAKVLVREGTLVVRETENDAELRVSVGN